jgi:hypothetical protein
MEESAQLNNLKPATREFLLALHEITFFAHVGSPSSDPTARHVHSWIAAMRNCNQQDWNNAQLDMSNDIGRRVRSVSKRLYSTWNSVVHRVNPHIEYLFRRKLRLFRVKFFFYPPLTHSIRCDLRRCCIEKEFQDLCGTGYSTRIGEHYLNGHLPCGWEGDYPRGRLIIF